VDGKPRVEITGERQLTVQHTGTPGGRPDVWVDGKKLDYETFPVYEGPYIKQAINEGRLWLSDGQRTLTIDVNGDVPTWTEGTDAAQ
jgi:hypothetical protein